MEAARLHPENCWDASKGPFRCPNWALIEGASRSDSEPRTEVGSQQAGITWPDPFHFSEALCKT